MKKRILGRLSLALALVMVLTLLSPAAVTPVEAAYKYDWASYGTDYFYKKMSSSEKKFYKQLDNLCLEYLNTKVSAEKSFEAGYGYYYYTEPVQTGLSNDAALRVINVFSYSNPQYYFLDHGYVTDYQGSYGLTVYKKFASGSARMKITKKMNKKINTWVKKVKKAKKSSGNYAAVAKAQELICKKVKYGQSTYDQSAYSVFFANRTVCAGYSAAFAIIMGACGYDTMCLTSSISGYEHEWNKIKIGKKWYNMDVTWDDLDEQDINGDGVADSFFYAYTLRSDNKFIYDMKYEYDGDTTSYYSHYTDAEFRKYGVPKSKKDTNPDYYSYYLEPGTL